MYTLQKLAEIVDGRIIGAGSTEITGTAVLSLAQPGDITFAREEKNFKQIDQSAATAVIVPQETDCSIPSIVVDDPETAFSEIVAVFKPQRVMKFQGVSPAAHVSDSAQLGSNVTIYPGAFVGDDVQIGSNTVIHSNASVLDGTVIGDDVTIFPGAVLYPDTQIGDRVIIHGTAVIGAYGFGYNSASGKHLLSPQLGRVVIGDDCDIGAGTTIDRGTYSDTIIGAGTKMDNQVMVGHNCRIGKHNLLVSQVGIAGSCSTGEYVVMAGQAGVGDHLHIGDRAILAAKTGIMNNVPSDETYIGIPGKPAKLQLQMFAVQAKLPEIRRDIKQIKRHLENLSANQQSVSINSKSDEKAA